MDQKCNQTFGDTCPVVVQCPWVPHYREKGAGAWGCMMSTSSRTMASVEVNVGSTLASMWLRNWQIYWSFSLCSAIFSSSMWMRPWYSATGSSLCCAAPVSSNSAASPDAMVSRHRSIGSYGSADGRLVVRVCGGHIPGPAAVENNGKVTPMQVLFVSFVSV